MLDLDEDGYPEPYIVTVHKDSLKVLRISRRFEEEKIEYTEKGEVARIVPEHYFTKYPFIPSIDGSFYDMGFGLLLNPLNESINTTINQMLDAGTLQNTGGGFVGSGLRLKSGAMRFRIGEWKVVDSPGGNVAGNVVPLDHKGPSSVLFNLPLTDPEAG